MKKILAILVAGIMVIGLAACGGSTTSTTAAAAGGEAAASAASGTGLVFGTGSDTGTYYGFGGVLASYVTSNSATAVTVVSSNGSQANIEDIDAGNIQLGFAQSDVMAYAFNGERLFEDAAISSFSTVAALYMEQVQIVTTDSSIKTVADLKGKNVSIGAVGSGVYFNAIDVLGCYDMTEDDINPVYQNFGDSADSLKDGKIDAAFIVAGAPTTAITDLATAKDVYLVSIDDEHIEKLVADSPYYTAYTIPANTYGSAPEATTVAVGAVVLANDSVSEDDVYNFVSTIFENAEAITEQHAKGAELDVEFASAVTSVPYHPGAAKYFAEKGITVATK